MLTLIQVPCLKDNAAWLVVNGPRAFVVDASEPEPVLARIATTGARLEAVVSTHHHDDHVGGNLALAAATGCAVVGNAADAARIPGITRPVVAGEHVDVAGVTLRALDVHAHTSGHVAWAMDRRFDRVLRCGHGGVELEIPALANRPALFVGDTLFLAGCGKLFEGAPADLERALRTLAGEDPQALVCCGHEYTRANLRFASSVRPDDARVAARAAALDEMMATSRSSLPGVLAEELVTNPFLLALAEPDPVAAVGALRRAKDAFV